MFTYYGKDYGTTNTRFQNSCELNGVVPLYLPCCPHLLSPVDIQTLQKVSPEYKSKLQELDKNLDLHQLNRDFLIRIFQGKTTIEYDSRRNC